MTVLFHDRVQESSTSTGTGDIALGGISQPGLATFSSAFSDGALVSYVVTNQAVNTEFERGIGTFHSGPDSISRTYVLAGTAYPSPTNFSAGTKNVVNPAPANTAGNAYASSYVYVPGDTAVLSGTTWYSLNVNSNSAPSTGNPNWVSLGGGGGGGAVTSVFSRTGAITAKVSDYSSYYPQTIATVAALRLYSGIVTGQQIVLNNYAVAGDGGGGPFYWGAYATDNGGTIITPTGQTAGSWYRILENNMMTVCQFGADKTGTNDSTTAFSNLHTAAGTSYDIGYEGGTYKVSSMPTISTPQTIRALGQVEIIHTGSGILWAIMDAHTNDAAPYIRGPIYLVPGSGTTELFRYEGTFFGSISGLFGDGTLNTNIIGCNIMDSPTAGSYYNVFENCIFKNCGTDWLLRTINHSLSSGYVNDNTFVNCKGQFAQFGGSIWAASRIIALNAYVVPTGTGGNFTGQLFQCTIAGITGSSEPNWSTATGLGNTVTDNTVTWTRISWDAVTKSGAGWLLIRAEGNTWIGGDAESNQGYSFISSKGSDYHNVQGLWIENSGTSLPAPVHSVLFDNLGNFVNTLNGIIFQPATIDGSIDINSGDIIGLWGSIPLLTGVQTTTTLTSGTAYQNAKGAWITLEVPVTFNPTSGAAATCSVARGSSSAPAILYTLSRPAGSQILDAEVTNVTLRVPPSWWYKFTVTNVTLGTATVLTG